MDMTETHSRGLHPNQSACQRQTMNIDARALRVTLVPVRNWYGALTRTVYSWWQELEDPPEKYGGGMMLMGVWLPWSLTGAW